MIGISTPANFGIILVAVTIVDLIVLFLIRYYPDFWGKSINVWYNQFGLNAVLADVLSITLGFLLSQFVYETFLLPLIGWNLLVFIGVLLLIQLVHDLFFYFGVIRPIDVFKAYADAGKGRILLADSSMMVGSALIATVLSKLPTSVTLFVGTLAAYAVPYILTTQNKYSAA